MSLHSSFSGSFDLLLKHFLQLQNFSLCFIVTLSTVIMILLYKLLFLNLFSIGISSPNLPQAIARINEARARAMTNRARARANSRMVINRMVHPSNRAKRNDFIEDEEPILLHVCPVDGNCESFFGEDDGYFGSVPRLYQQYKNSGDERDADAHLHSHSHSHIHSHQHQHGHGFPLPPSNHLNVPGLNLHINQNQGLQPNLHHGLLPTQTVQNLNVGVDTHPPYTSGHLKKSNEDEDHEEFLINDETNQPTFNEKDDVIDFLSRNHQDRLSYLFNIPQYHHPFNDDRKKRSLGEILGRQRQVVETLKNQTQSDDLQLIGDIGDRILTELENKHKKITKRAIPLMRLISDPNVKLDVPKTIENFGTATRNVFEDEKAPMYHLRNLVGSSKNAILSAMRVPPQNLLIPSDYQIVKTNERVEARNPSIHNRNRDEDPTQFSQTFRKVGEIVRDSIKSSQDTASHIGDVAHEARNILHSARHSAPRLIIPYSQIPAVKDSRKAVLITPRILGLSQDRTQPKSDDYIHLGHLMDAVGFSKPNSHQLDLDKIIFEPRKLKHAKVNEKLAQLYNRFNDDYDDNLGDALNTLEDAKISVGAKNLRDFLVKMKNELTSVGGGDHHRRTKYKSKKKKQQETQEVGKFIENLFDGNSEETNETVGAGMNLPPELLHPFMGRASKKDLEAFYRENGDKNVVVGLTLDNQTLGNFLDYLKTKDQLPNNSHKPDLGYVLGAVNPLMFERMFNHTVKVNNNNADNPQVAFGRPFQDYHESDGTVGTAMTLDGAMLKPFMGQAQPEAVEEFLDTYNGDHNESVQDDE